jgi:hypothetical protein
MYIVMLFKPHDNAKTTVVLIIEVDNINIAQASRTVSFKVFCCANCNETIEFFTTCS